MPQPFSPDIATELIRENPSKTSKEIVRDALDRGIIGSRGRDPLAGQGGALVKMFLQDRLPDIWRDESSHPYRYYPKRTGNEPLNGKQSSPMQPSAQGITFRPTVEQERVLASLDSVGAFSTRTEAIQWLLDQGIAAEHDLIQKALEAHKQIEDLRKGVVFDRSKSR